MAPSCCYPDVEALVTGSVARTRRLYGLVYPLDRWWTRMMGCLGNAMMRLLRNDFRIHIHPDASVECIVSAAGFERRHRQAGWFWQTLVYVRR